MFRAMTASPSTLSAGNDYGHALAARDAAFFDRVRVTIPDATRHGAERSGFNCVQARMLVDAGRFKAANSVALNLAPNVGVAAVRMDRLAG
jgi:hypothetical protein